jgi:hypothetical protein
MREDNLLSVRQESFPTPELSLRPARVHLSLEFESNRFRPEPGANQ